MKYKTLKKGDSIAVVAPSRPIYNIKKDINIGLKKIESLGFVVKPGKYLNKRDYYSAGTAAERAADLHNAFSDSKTKAIIAATGGATANQLLDILNYELIKKNPKVFMGYSDLTMLLLAINKKCGFVTFYGSNVRGLTSMTPAAEKFTFSMIEGRVKTFTYPTAGQCIKPGKAKGKLIGGTLSVLVGLFGTPFQPNFSGKILFWEEVGLSPAMIDCYLQQLRLAGVFDEIKGMVVGHLADCVDKKYPQDNKSIKKIILERTKGYNFPILKVDYFGHCINNFYCLPIGGKAFMDVNKKILSVKI